MAAIALWPYANAMAKLEPRVERVLRDPLVLKELAVTGKDLMIALAMPPGPAIGRILAMLVDRVLDDPAANNRETLLGIAQELELELGR